MLKMTGVEIESLRDMDMVLFLENNIRGGVSFINQRHCKASSSYRSSSYRSLPSIDSTPPPTPAAVKGRIKEKHLERMKRKRLRGNTDTGLKRLKAKGGVAFRKVVMLYIDGA
jgi:hypothetical protein